MTIEMIEKLIHAWRNSKHITDKLEEAFGVPLDAMYDVHGNILDALREYAFETGDLNDSKILYWLVDGEVRKAARDIYAMHESKMISGSAYIQQPKPTFFTQEQINRMQEVLGGYTHGN